jgi:hypothetical protein
MSADTDTDTDADGKVVVFFQEWSPAAEKKVAELIKAAIS